MKAERAFGGCCDVVYDKRSGPRMAHLRLGSRTGRVGGPSYDPGGWWLALVAEIGVAAILEGRLAQPRALSYLPLNPHRLP